MELLTNPVVFEREGNDFWPLPSDYPTLNQAGQRMARVNAVSLNQTPALNTVGWDFFVKYYLETQPPGVWYKPPLYPSPPCHYAYTSDIHEFARVVQVFPRSFAKTTLMRSNILRWIYTKPFFKVLIIKSRDDFVREDFQTIMWQLENNERLRHDFGDLKPKRGSGIWSQSRLWLTNGFQLVGRSVTSQLLGFRPNAWFLDDAEFSGAMFQQPANLTENLRYLLYNDLEPMLDVGCIGVIQGTLHNRRMLVYEAATISEEEEPRWAFWHRTIYPAKLPDGALMWPEKFSEERLQERKEALGPAGFASQFMNDPGTESEHILQIHPLLGQYTVKDKDDALETKPLSSSAKLVSWLPKGITSGDRLETEEIERPFGETVSGMYRALLVDPARTTESYSDFSAVLCVGIEHSAQYHDHLWLLDAYAKKVQASELMEEIWQMALKWRVRIVGIESVAAQMHFTDQCQGDFLRRSEREQWMPRIFPVDYKGELNKSKAARIQLMAWRFEQHRVKFPRHLASKRPWSDLYEQVRLFTPDLALLKNDDLLDALAQIQWVVKPKGNYRDNAPDTAPDPLELLAAGYTYYPGTKFRIIDSIDAHEIPRSVRLKMMDKRVKWKKERNKGIKVIPQGRKRGRLTWPSE